MLFLWIIGAVLVWTSAFPHDLAPDVKARIYMGEERVPFTPEEAKGLGMKYVGNEKLAASRNDAAPRRREGPSDETSGSSRRSRLGVIWQQKPANTDNDEAEQMEAHGTFSAREQPFLLPGGMDETDQWFERIFNEVENLPEKTEPAPELVKLHLLQKLAPLKGPRAVPEPAPRREPRATTEPEADVAAYQSRAAGASKQDLEDKSEFVPTGLYLQRMLGMKNRPNLSIEQFLPLNFKDYGLLSIQDHQREQRQEDAELPPKHDQQILSSDLTNPHDALHMRQAGPLCGVFLDQSFHAELRAVNATAFMLRNVYSNSRQRFHHLQIIYHTSTNKNHSTLLQIDPSTKLALHFENHLLETGMRIEDISRVEIVDSLNKFSVHVNISRCVVPIPLRLGNGFQKTTNGVQSGDIILHTSNVLVINDFSYLGNCPEAFFFAGRFNDPTIGFIIPTLDGSESPLRVHTSEEVWLVLPYAYTFYDLHYVGVYCRPPHQIWAYFYLSDDYWQRYVLPPALLSEGRLLYKHSTTLD